jgi:serine/threonine-protein kinase
MTLTAGIRLGIYEITGQLGVGGMGEVYRAKDTKLGRDVAIKVLPESFATDAGRIARFEQEAKTLAALNHANIAHIHGLERVDGTTAIVMELVDGPTLADRIAEGALPAQEAMGVAMQIVAALEAAHERGIVHRDLKPANIKLAPDGTVKVLDFGIAKALEPLPAASGAQSPIMTTPVTQVGVILGTAAYMSPEQARGKAIDQRTDIWAFGCVLYEMLSGQPAFGGEDVPLTLARVLAAETNMDSLPSMISPAVRQTLRLCLQKDLKERVADIRDVRLALKGSFETVVSTAPGRLRAWQRPVPIALGALALLVLAVVATWLAKPEAAREVLRATLTPPASMSFAASFDTSLVISLDGRRIVYRGRFDGQPRLFVRDLTELEAKPLPGLTDDVRGVFVSPDGQWVGFSDGTTLYKVSIFGGSRVKIAELDSAPRGATWGRDDTIVFATAAPTGLQRVPAAGGTPEPLTTTNGAEDHLWPAYLPDGNAVLFTIAEQGSPDAGRIAVLSLGDLEQKVLIAGGTAARYVPTGHIVYSLGDTLLAVGFDPDRLEVTTAPVPVAEGVNVNDVTGAANFGVADNGTLAYARGGQAAASASLVWVNRAGQQEPLPLAPAAYSWPRISPNGAQIAVSIGQQDVWVADIARGTLSRVTTTPGTDNVPTWTLDGERLVFASMREGGGKLSFFTQRADGTGAAEKLLASAGNGHFKPYAWSPDGARLVFDYGQPPRLDIGVLSLDGSGSWEPLLHSEANEAAPALSPDGHWIAYTSDQTGSCEIYVEGFPELGSRQRISTAGGAEAAWSPDGRELYYREGDRLMSVAIDTEGSFTVGSPQVLFGGLPPPNCLFRDYDVSPDGQRFLVTMAGTGGDDAAPPDIVIVQNWFEELKRLVPTE